MSAPTLIETEEATRQIQAALKLKRRYEALQGRPVSISALRKDAAQLRAFRAEVEQIGDPELTRLVAAAFDPGLPAARQPWRSASASTATAEVSSQGGEAAPPGQAGPAPRAAAAQPWWRRPAMIAIGLAALVLVSALVSQLIRAPAGSGATAAAALPPGAALSHPMLRLHGSNTIGEKLAPMLIQGFLADEGGTEIKVVDGSDPVERNVVARLPKESGPVAVQLFAHGSATAFADLEASNTDIGMASRP
ncbi:MAG TPA: hypothetical protein VF229_01160, partial [Burkholderiaceae bacterium]